MAIERERLRQNPLRVYAELIAQKTLPLPLSQRFRRLVGSLHQIGGSKSKEGAYALSQPFFSENNFSVDDFWIAEDGVEGSLDLIGICRKD